MIFKQTTTVIYTQEVELTEDEALEIIGIPEVRAIEISNEIEADLINYIIGKLDSSQTLTVNTEIHQQGICGNFGPCETCCNCNQESCRYYNMEEIKNRN